MSNLNSPIQWTDVTWSPVVGCTRVSAGCDHCYAFQLHDQRHIAWKRGRWSDAPAQYHLPFSRVQLLPQRLEEPLHWRKPRHVFVDSMTDLLHDDIPDDYLAQVFAVMAIASDHTFQVLTKRPERMQRLMSDHTFEAMVDTHVDRLGSKHGWICMHEVDAWPLPNVWLGVSVENQAAADERIPLLLQTPAAVRFLSCEPLLGPVDLRDVHYDNMVAIDALTGEHGWPTPHAESDRRLHWVIVGGESGPHARPMDVAWARSLVEQCREAGVAVFVKQLGTVNAKLFNMRDRHGGDIEEWREWHLLPKLDVREFPQTARVDVTEVAP